MFCCHRPEILKFLTRGSQFHFSRGPANHVASITQRKLKEPSSLRKTHGLNAEEPKPPAAATVSDRISRDSTRSSGVSVLKVRKSRPCRLKVPQKFRGASCARCRPRGGVSAASSSSNTAPCSVPASALGEVQGSCPRLIFDPAAWVDLPLPPPSPDVRKLSSSSAPRPKSQSLTPPPSPPSPPALLRPPSDTPHPPPRSCIRRSSASEEGVS